MRAAVMECQRALPAASVGREHFAHSSPTHTRCRTTGARVMMTTTEQGGG